MTHIIIGRETELQKQYLLSLISHFFGREFNESSLISNPDIHILDIEENKSIGIEDVKEFQKEMQYKPFQEKYQIGVVFNANKLTTEAQNSFLKTLEEQPDSTIFVLLIKDEKDVLETILSRGIKHHLKNEREEEITDTIPSILELDLVDQFKKIEELCEGDSDGILAFIKELQLYFKQRFKEKIMSEEDVSSSMKQVEIVNAAYDRIQNNGNKKLVLENMIIQLK